MRYVKALCAAAVLAGLLATGAAAQMVVEAGGIRFAVGDAKAEHAVFVIKPRLNSRHVIQFNVYRAGKPGSKVALRVDGAAEPVYSTVLSAKSCRAEKDVPVCSVTVPGRSKEADAIIAAFTKGQVLHVDVEHEGAMTMQGKSSLEGFMAAFQKGKR